MRFKWFSRSTAIDAVISTERTDDDPRPQLRLLVDGRPSPSAEQRARNRTASWRWPD
jgi:hypothetical protein